MKKLHMAALGLATLLALALAGAAWAGSSAHYAIDWQVTGGGGAPAATAGGVTLNATLGQTAIRLSSSSSSGLSAGYWYTNASRRTPVYLPLVVKGYAPPALAPDLVVERIVAAGSQVQVVIRNRGNAAVAASDEFWVDLYINPSHAPAYNETWPLLGSRGATWGVTAPALPLAAGGVFTLTTGGDYYWPTKSHIVWPLAAGTAVYAQVDSANAATAYGAVPESDESNNVGGPVAATAARAARSPAEGPGGPKAGSGTSLPERP
jgi:hypothetical protein